MGAHPLSQQAGSQGISHPQAGSQTGPHGASKLQLGSQIGAHGAQGTSHPQAGSQGSSQQLSLQLNRRLSRPRSGRFGAAQGSQQVGSQPHDGGAISMPQVGSQHTGAASQQVSQASLQPNRPNNPAWALVALLKHRTAANAEMVKNRVIVQTFRFMGGGMDGTTRSLLFPVPVQDHVARQKCRPRSNAKNHRPNQTLWCETSG
ncbi:MAG: hypothetical protein AAFN70_19555, partial [Planctomycetota bacterium]